MRQTHYVHWSDDDRCLVDFEVAEAWKEQAATTSAMARSARFGRPSHKPRVKRTRRRPDPVRRGLLQPDGSILWLD